MKWKWFLFLSFFILSSCQKHVLEPKDLVQVIVSRLTSLSKLTLPLEYTLIRSEVVKTSQQDLLTAEITMDRSYMQKLSDQFRMMRRKSSGPGYGKIPGGWEFYYELKENEQYKMVIDTFSNRLTLSHRILY